MPKQTILQNISTQTISVERCESCKHARWDFRLFADPGGKVTGFLNEQFDCLCLKRNISFVDDGFEPPDFGDDTNCFETDPEDRYHCLVIDYGILVERYNRILRKFWDTKDERPLEDRLEECASTDVETLREREFSDWLQYLHSEDRELYETVTKDCDH